MIKAVLFDFDGVLTTDATGTQSIRKYICSRTGLSQEEFNREYGKHNNDLLYGRINHKDMWEAFCDGVNIKIGMELLHESFINTPIDGRMMKLVERLKSLHYKVGMVTDNKKDRMDDIIQYHDWKEIFDTITVSADIGSGKEESDIFLKTLECLHVAASECVFIDNQEKNLAVPKSMGMNVINFDHKKRDYEALIQEFGRLSMIL